MPIGRTISIKISNYNILIENFIKIIEIVNKENNLNLSELPLDYVWGYQDGENLRINFTKSKNKVEFVTIFDNEDDIDRYINMISSFIKHAQLDFKFISLSFGNVYKDVPIVDYKFILPEFSNPNALKYKLSSEIHNLENGDIYLSTNFHFYNFFSQNKDPKQTILEDILKRFEEYYLLFQKMTGNI